MNRYLLLLVSASLSLPGCATEVPQPKPQVQPSLSASYDCSQPGLSSAETLICSDPQLVKLDNQMAKVYAQATEKAQNEHPSSLAAMQRGWIKGRNECWKSTEPKQCISDSYTQRITELQAKYRLVNHSEPVYFGCDGNPANEVVVTYFSTEPASLIAEYGDSSSLMTLQPSASGTRYQGRNESFWEHQGEASITWGYNAPEMKCKVKQ
ncbi:MliC family protein [Shewanella sp. Isolate11]|uniref:MliC family protein n=1 Tax=Shewanella sp. Isolate11 TaxID=2908530 RepID=UPI001EFCD58F|nr:MliC family protein [Shewanella sp. Isolate11]MCG9698207.1 MliC family protein [Shewanella sp. Isolate11]